MKSKRYGIIHAHAQCRDCEWGAGLNIRGNNPMGRLRAQIKSHVEKKGHSVDLETGSATIYTP